MKKLFPFLIALLFAGTVFSQEKKEVKIYNVQANAREDIKNAVSQAAKENKHVLVQTGGNWCGWCIAFHNLVDTTASLKKYIDDNFVTVLVNYSPENKNEPTFADLGFPQRFGFPAFIVLDGKGKVLHIENSSYLETDAVDEKGRKKVGHDVKKIMGFLSAWTVVAVNPATYKTSTK